MSKLIWNTLKLSPLLLTATLVLADRTQATETQVVDLAQNQTAAVSSRSSPIAKLKRFDPKPLHVAQQQAQDVISQPVQNNLSTKSTDAGTICHPTV